MAELINVLVPLVSAFMRSGGAAAGLALTTSDTAKKNTAAGAPVVRKKGWFSGLFAGVPKDTRQRPDPRSNDFGAQYSKWQRNAQQFAAGALVAKTDLDSHHGDITWLEKVQKTYPHEKLYHAFNYPQVVGGIQSHYRSMFHLPQEETEARIDSEMKHIASLDPIYQSLLTHPAPMLPDHPDYDIKKEYDRIAYQHGPDTKKAFKQQHQAWNNKLAYDAHNTLHANPSPYVPIPEWINELGIKKDVDIQEAFQRIDKKYNKGTELANRYKSELAYIYWQHIHAEPPKRVVVLKPMLRAPPQNTLPPHISKAEAEARFRAYANANPHSQPWHQPQPQQWHPQPQQSQWQSQQPQWQSRTDPTAKRAWDAYWQGLKPVRSFSV